MTPTTVQFRLACGDAAVVTAGPHPTDSTKLILEAKQRNGRWCLDCSEHGEQVIRSIRMELEDA